MKDDLISRQAAIDAAISADMENHSGILSEKRARVIDRHISALPSAQPDITEKQIAEYCRKRNLVLITHESYAILKAYYNRMMKGDGT